MRIERLFLKDVGPFDEATIEFPEGTDPERADVYLLTGPNGCGKSTALYAIASAIGQGRFGQDLLLPRLRTNRACAMVDISDGERAAMNVTGRRFVKSDLLALSPEEEFVYSGNLPEEFYSTQDPVTQVRLGRPSNAQSARTWAGFAYAGRRSVEQVEVTSIREPLHDPLAKSLSFFETVKTGDLANWIVSQQFKRLKAKDAGHGDRAEQLERSVRDIEAIIADIIDDPTFAFVTNVDDNNVRIRRDGKVIELGLLPDGLKSIVSWIADLLMRLDRLPWVDNIPPMQRSFLLLLDEIDIHLHPAWQRKVLPIVQRVFPKAQIIASTHSPFVVASAADAHIITLALKDGAAHVERMATSQLGVSYSAVLRSIFGIASDFDVDTEQLFEDFHKAKARLLRGDDSARIEVDALAAKLAQRSEEVGQLIAIERRQLDRQLAQLAARTEP